MDWLDLLAVQGTLKSLLQHHSSKQSILQCSAFFIVQLSDSYMTTGKTIALTKQISFCKVMSLLFNMLSRLVITFLPRSKRLLISCLQSPSAVILVPPKIKSGLDHPIQDQILNSLVAITWVEEDHRTHLSGLACSPHTLPFPVLQHGVPIFVQRLLDGSSDRTTGAEPSPGLGQGDPA